MAKIVMAVGKSLGPWFDPAKPEKQEPEYFVIQAGNGIGQFTLDQALIWDAAHRELESQASHTFNRAALEASVRKNSHIKNPTKDVDFLLSEGVLVEVDFADDRATEKFLKKYRLIPTAFSMGNYKDKRDLYTLSIGEEIVTPISYPARSIWAWSYLEGSIWAGCESSAKNWRKGGRDATAANFASEIAEYLPVIVARLAGVLEPV